MKSLPPMVAGLGPRLKAPPKVADRFYSSPAWRRLVARIRAERGDRCEETIDGKRCGSRHRVIADHIVERFDGGAELDPGNVRLLCQACHNRKTAAARKRRAAGR